MINICANNKCGKVFFFKPIYVGLGTSIFCSHNCKENHIYDDIKLIAQQKDNRNTFQCPHCNKIRKSSNPYQKICASKQCADAQRKKKRELLIYQYNQKLKEKHPVRNESMEIAMLDAIERSHRIGDIPLHKREILTKNCVECNNSYQVKAGPNGSIRQTCSDEKCKKSYQVKYQRAVYEKFKAKWIGREDEKRLYNKRNNDRSALKKKMKKAALMATGVPQSPLSFPTVEHVMKTPIIDMPMQVGGVEIVAKNSKELQIKHHLDALFAILQPQNKYQPLINYLEANKIDNMAKMSELMAIVAKISDE